MHNRGSVLREHDEDGESFSIFYSALWYVMMLRVFLYRVAKRASVHSRTMHTYRMLYVGRLAHGCTWQRRRAEEERARGVRTRGLIVAHE